MFRLLGEIFDSYSEYTGMSILMVLFFVSLIYIALRDENRNNKTVILYGTIALVCSIFFPVIYWAYSRYVDSGTYWRMFWMLPMAIGIAYVGAKLVDGHRVTGFLLTLFVLVLGGRFVYTMKPEFKFATNPYHIEQSTIDVADYLATLDIENYQVAVPFEMLAEIREYNSDITMPYGREQYITTWGTRTGFYEQMLQDPLDFRVLADKCRFNNTKYLVISKAKGHYTEPEDYGFTLLKAVGGYDIYEYMGL